MPYADPEDRKIKRQRERRAQDRGYSGTPREERYDAKDARRMAAREDVRRAIRRALAAEFGPDALTSWPEGDELGA